MKRLVLILFLCTTILAENPYRILNSFSGGELSFLNAREDLAKFQTGCSIMENLIPIPQGAAQKRPGTKFIAEVKDSSAKTRLLEFEFSTSQAYIIETGNQYMRFYTDGARISTTLGNEDISSLDNILAHWKLNDALATTAVIDADGATHDGVATTNTNVLRTIGAAGTGCFDFAGVDMVVVTSHADFTFIEGVDGDFSLMGWIFVQQGTVKQVIISKFDTNGKREWHLSIAADRDLELLLSDQSAGINVRRSSDMELSFGWHHVVATYEGNAGGWAGATAMNHAILYVDGASVASTAENNAGYAGMEALTGDVSIGASLATGVAAEVCLNKIDDVSVFGDILTPSEISTYYADTVTAIVEIETPYLTADLFNLKVEQSADVLYITHPDYEPRKLSRLSDAEWVINAIDIQTGPFRSENLDIPSKISASGTTGSVTLTATGGAPFFTSHVPSGSSATSKSQTGALFKLVHPLDDLSFSDTLEDDIGASSTEGVSWMSCGTLFKGAEWHWVTGGTWLGKVAIQRNYTIGAAFGDAGWETVLPFEGVTTARNVDETGSEDDGDADYRVAFLDDTSGTVISYFTTDQTSVEGIVEITAVTNSSTATGTVLKTLASTDATHRWSEGSWSNFRGWPQTASFFEDRLMFGGNTAQPDTIWGSVVSDYSNMEAGVDDADAVIFTLSSRQVNVIEWLIGKDKLLIGTSGAEWTIEGGTDEPLTPSNVIAKQHSTYGSANLQANIANESVLFFQRGKEKMRELAYNWELDSYVAPDMTILSSLVTNSGIDDTTFQKTPDSILWCVRADGELPVFSYERSENITAWSRMITHTNLAGTLTDSDFESVARISGATEDEIWVIVERTINSSTVRYIEQIQSRDFGDDAEDAFYVDCGITYDSTASSAMTGLTHLEGQTIYVLADGVVFDTEVVSSGAITLSLNNVTTTASTVQMGLGYEVNMRTMPLSFIGSETIHGKMKRISEVISEWYLSGDFSIGKDASNLQAYGITGQTTDIDRKTFPPGWDRNGYIFIYQLSPEPLTLLSIMAEFNLQ